MSNPHSPQQESGRREAEGTRLVLPDAIKSVQLASLQLHGSEKATGESLPAGQGAPCPAGHSFKCRMKLSIPGVPSAPFQSHANLAAHGLCHVSELHQMLWSLVMEPVTKVPTATPTYSTRLANRLHGTRASVRTPCEVGTCLGVRSFGEEDAGGRPLSQCSQVCRMRQSLDNLVRDPMHFFSRFWARPLCLFSRAVNSHHLRTPGLRFSLHLKGPAVSPGNYSSACSSRKLIFC